MEGAAALAALWLLHFASSVTPGPNTLLVTGLAVMRSRRSATFAALGTVSGTIVWLALTFGGAAALLALYPGAVTALRWAGAAYLFYLGLSALLGAWRAGRGGESAGALAAATDGGAWRLGLATNLSNPKSLAYYLGLLAATNVAAAAPAMRVAAGAGMLAISLGWYLALAWLFSRPVTQALYRRARPIIEGCVGGLMIGFAILLALAGG